MILEFAPDVALEDLDLLVEGTDEAAQGLDARRVGRGELRGVQEDVARDAEQVGHGDVHALFGEHGVYLELQVGAQADELCPVAD